MACLECIVPVRREYEAKSDVMQSHSDSRTLMATRRRQCINVCINLNAAFAKQLLTNSTCKGCQYVSCRNEGHGSEQGFWLRNKILICFLFFFCSRKCRRKTITRGRTFPLLAAKTTAESHWRKPMPRRGNEPQNATKRIKVEAGRFPAKTTRFLVLHGTSATRNDRPGTC